MERNSAVEMLHQQREFFLRSTSVFDEADSNFRPTTEQRTVAQMMRHTWRSVKWFTDAVFTDIGFSMDFEGDERETQQAVSVEEERKLLDQEYDRAIEFWGALSEEQVAEPIPDNPLFGPVPKLTLVFACHDHTAHHRGALTVYARALGKVPHEPYADM